jgi:hypothetical protein
MIEGKKKFELKRTRLYNRQSVCELMPKTTRDQLCVTKSNISNKTPTKAVMPDDITEFSLHIKSLDLHT